MKKYFIYYSNSGNGDIIAEFLRDRDFEIVKVQTVKKQKRMGFFRIFKYGFKAMKESRVPIQGLNLKFNEDDYVVIGSPIWNDRISCPIWSTLDQLDLNKENTKFIFYSGGGQANHAKEQIEKLGFKKEPLILKQPTKYIEEAKAACKLI